MQSTVSNIETKPKEVFTQPCSLAKGSEEFVGFEDGQSQGRKKQGSTGIFARRKTRSGTGGIAMCGGQDGECQQRLQCALVLLLRR
jgi:hypothetical protein